MSRFGGFWMTLWRLFADLGSTQAPPDFQRVDRPPWALAFQKGLTLNP